MVRVFCVLLRNLCVALSCSWTFSSLGLISVFGLVLLPTRLKTSHTWNMTNLIVYACCMKFLSNPITFLCLTPITVTFLTPNVRPTLESPHKVGIVLSKWEEAKQSKIKTQQLPVISNPSLLIILKLLSKHPFPSDLFEQGETFIWSKLVFYSSDEYLTPICVGVQQFPALLRTITWIVTFRIFQSLLSC